MELVTLAFLDLDDQEENEDSDKSPINCMKY